MDLIRKGRSKLKGGTSPRHKTALTKPAFLRLPAELRNHIYELVVADETKWRVTIRLALAFVTTALLPRKSCPFARTCHKVRDEILPMLQKYAGPLRWELATHDPAQYGTTEELTVGFDIKYDSGHRSEASVIHQGGFHVSLALRPEQAEFSIVIWEHEWPAPQLEMCKRFLLPCIIKFLEESGRFTAADGAIALGPFAQTLRTRNAKHRR